MNDTTVGFLVLEMEEPVFTILGMHPTSLMRAVDVGLALSQHNLMFVRTVGRLGAHGQLETVGNTSRRTHNPVPALALIELRTFAGAILRAIAIKHDDGLSDSLGAIGRHLANGEHGGKLRARIGPSVDQIATAIVVPQRSGVDIALATNDTDWLFPLASGILRLDHIYTIVGVAPIDVVPPLMIADAGCPHASAMLGRAEMMEQRIVALIEILQGIAHDFPVDQVLRVQDRQSRGALERGSRHVIILARGSYADIRVGVIGINHWVGVGAIAIVGRPHLRLVLCTGCECRECKNCKNSSSHSLFILSL